MNRIGDFAQGDFQAMRMAEAMQSLAMEYINESFFAKEDLNLDNLTLSNFLKELDKAKDGGPVAQFELNRQLAKIIQSVVPQVMQQSQQQQPTGGTS